MSSPHFFFVDHVDHKMYTYMTVGQFFCVRVHKRRIQRKSKVDDCCYCTHVVPSNNHARLILRSGQRGIHARCPFFMYLKTNYCTYVRFVRGVFTQLQLFHDGDSRPECRKAQSINNTYSYLYTTSTINNGCCFRRSTGYGATAVLLNA